MVDMPKELAQASLAKLKAAKKLPTPDEAAPKSFVVRPGTLAVCRALIGGNVQEGAAFHAILELWVNIRKKLSRKIEGEMKPCIWLSGSDLETLTGQDLKSLQNRVLKSLKNKPFIVITPGRLKPDGPNGYVIHIDVKALWETLAWLHGHTLTILTAKIQAGAFSDGPGPASAIGKVIDRSKLPHLFKLLYDDYVKDNGEYEVTAV
jgi:hypothetical protein